MRSHAVLCVFILAAFSDATPLVSPGLNKDLKFTEYPNSTAWGALLDRLLSPMQSWLAHHSVTPNILKAQPIDLSKEHFLSYVPMHAPPEGFGLLVFVPPWERAEIPSGWARVLESHGIIFITMAQAGNTQSILMRREPLALLAAENMLKGAPIDPGRVYIGGFSGGSRVAMRLALAFPDLFRGALLIAGSDPIGTADAPLPGPELMERFRKNRVVFISGQRDSVNVDKDAGTAQSLQRWCAFDFLLDSSSLMGHEVPGPTVLDSALTNLTRHQQLDTAKADLCRIRVQHALDVKMARADAAVAKGKNKEASDLLRAIDIEFGGLAAPGTLDLQDKIR